MIASRSQRRDVRVGGTVALAGLVVLAVSALLARNGRVGPAERSVFDAINGLPDWLYRPLWIFQQFGNFVVALLVVLVVAALLRRADLAAAALVAVVAKLLLERAVKSLVERSRPGTTVPDAILRGEVSPGGLSFVSGHATITVAMAIVLTAVLPRRWWAAVWLVVVLNGFTRIYVGAHNPLDIVGGTGLGLVIAGPLYAWLAGADPASR